MKIESVKLKNFKQHKDREFQFSSGTNLIVGPNYSGKSTIQQAVLVAMLGVSVVDEAAADLVHDDAKDFNLELKLSNGYVVERSTKNASITRAGEDKAFVNGHTAVNAHILELLDMSKAAFFKIFVSAQGEPQELLRMDGPALTRFVEAATGMDKLNAIIKLAGARASSEAAKADALHAFLLPEEPAFYAMQKTELGIQVADLLLQITEHEKGISKWATKADALSEELKALDHNQRLWEKYRHRKDILEKDLSAVEPDAKQPLADTSALEADIAKDYTLRAEADSYAKQLARLTAEHIKTMQAEKSYLDAINLFTGTFPEPLSSDAEKAEVNRLSVFVNESAAGYKAVKQAIEDNICVTCKRPFDTHKTPEAQQVELADALTKYTYAKAEYDKAKAAFDVADREAKEYAKQAAAYSRNMQGRGDCVVRLVELTKEIAGIPEPITNLYALSDRIAVNSDALKRQQHRNAAIASAQATKDKLLMQLIDLEDSKPDLELAGDVTLLQEACDNCRSESAKLHTALSTLRVDHSSAVNRLETLTQQLTDNENMQATYLGHVDKQGKLDHISKLLSKNRVRYLEETWENLFGAASEFVSMATGGDIEKMFLSDSGIKYVENGRVRNKWSASGAQKSLMGLGLKVALTQLVTSPFDSLILDEISADCSPEISLACLMSLQNYSEQTIVVSHREFDVAANVIDLGASA